VGKDEKGNNDLSKYGSVSDQNKIHVSEALSSNYESQKSAVQDQKFDSPNIRDQLLMPDLESAEILDHTIQPESDRKVSQTERKQNVSLARDNMQNNLDFAASSEKPLPA
jgi:hypothetical protein